MIGVDTTFLIHLLRNDKGALIKADELDKQPFCFTTEASVYEIMSGIRASKVDVKKAIDDLERLLSRFTVLSLDRKSAIYAGTIASKLIENGQMIDDVDCIIAGILLSNGCDRIITRNMKHFKRIKELDVQGY